MKQKNKNLLPPELLGEVLSQKVLNSWLKSDNNDSLKYKAERMGKIGYFTINIHTLGFKLKTFFAQKGLVLQSLTEKTVGDWGLCQIYRWDNKKVVLLKQVYRPTETEAILEASVWAYRYAQDAREINPSQQIVGIKVFVKGQKEYKIVRPRCELCKFAEPDENLENLFCTHSANDGIKVADGGYCENFDISKQIKRDLADGLIE